MEKSQSQEVLRILKETGRITSAEAFSNYGISRLSAIIYNLRRNGYNIVSIQNRSKNRYGHICNFSEYRLVK